MFKRFIARLLIILQVYGVLFQGVAHANVLLAYPVRDEIYLHGSFHKDGGLRVALGTNAASGGSLEVLKLFEVPSYKTLKDTQKGSSSPLISPDITETESIGFVTKDGITRLPEGIYFTIQGLAIFMNNEGELLIQGSQTDHTKPIFLSSEKSIVLNNVYASTIKLISSSVVGIGHSDIDFLSLEGLTGVGGGAAKFVNSGTLTAKKIFLRNLNSTNAGIIRTGGIEAQKRIFTNSGTIEADEEVVLGVDEFINSGRITADSIHGSAELAKFENTHEGKIIIAEEFTTGQSATVVNNGSIDGGHHQFAGLSFLQSGTLKGESLNLSGTGEFQNDGNTEITGPVSLSLQRYINRNVLKVGSITCADSLTCLENSLGASIILQGGSLETSRQTVVKNEGSITGGAYKFKGPIFRQRGVLIGTSLSVSGGPEFDNEGKVDICGSVSLDVLRFINKDSLKAGSVIGSKLLSHLENARDSSITLYDGGTFKTENTTTVVNDGTITGGAYNFKGPIFRQRGTLIGTSLSVSGPSEFENLGDIDIMGLVSLDVLRFINSDSLKAGSVIGSKLLSHLENARGASIILYDGGTFKTANTTMVMNDGSITGGSYEFGGPSLVQQGILKGKSLKVRNGSEIITSDNQEMEIVDAIETCFAGPWALRGKTKTTRFSHLGSLDLFGILEVVGEFEGSGTIRSTGQLIGRAIDFLDDMTVLGEVEAERLTAIKKLVVNGKVKVKRAISTKGGLKVGDRGVFQGASLSVSGTPEFENLGDIDIADSVSLNVSRFINSNSLKAKSITGSILLTYLENARDASIVLRGGVFKTLSRTMVVNDGSIVGGSYEFAGPSLVQQGILKGKALRIRNGSTFITSKTQEMEIIDAIETCSADPYVLRGKIETARFSHLGNIELFGILRVTDSFDGSGIIQPSGRLYAKSVGFLDDMTVLGEVEAEQLSAENNLVVNGKVKVAKHAALEGNLSVGEGGAFEGVQGEELILGLKGSAEIAGKVDVDVLTAAKAITVKRNGKLLTQKSTTLTQGIAIAQEAIAKLKGLKVTDGAISNQGILNIIGIEPGRAELNLTNTGIASIDAEQVLPRASTQDSQNFARIATDIGPKAIDTTAAQIIESSAIPIIKMILANQTTGQLTLKAGRFDFVGGTAFVNEGMLFQEQAYIKWVTRIAGAFNRGTWTVKGSLALLGYKAEDIGRLEVDEALGIHTSLDTLEGFKGLEHVDAKKIVMHANCLNVKRDHQFAMPMELQLQGVLSLQAKLKAAAFVVNARTLELGSVHGAWGVLSAQKDGVKICVDSFRNMFGHITAMKDGEIIVNGDEFVNGSYSLVQNYIDPAVGVLAYKYSRERNGAAISVGGRLKIAVKGLNALLNNHYGLIQSDGYLELFSQKRILNLAGIISSNGGGLLSASEIIAQRDEISKKQHGSKFCDGHFYRKKGCQVRDSCSGGNQCTTPYVTREQSDESWINIGGGDLEIDADTLSVIASHIVSKGRLFLKRQNIDLPKSEDGELKGIAGVLVQSHQDQMTYTGMTPRGVANLVVHKAGILSYSDMGLESHGLRIEGVTTAQTMDVVKALVQTVKAAGFDVTVDQARSLLIDIASGANYQASEPHSLIVHLEDQFLYDVPFERKEMPTYGRGPIPILTHSYEGFETIQRPICHVVSKMVLEHLLDNLVLKVLRNPEGSDFSRRLYENTQEFAIKNMQKRLLRSKEAATEDEAIAIVESRYHQLIPITYEDMDVYARDMRTFAKKMLMFEFCTHIRSIEKLKRMEEGLDQEVCSLRPKIFVPKEAVSKDATSADIRSDGVLNNHVSGDMTMRGAAGYSGHGGTTRVTGILKLEAVAIRQGTAENFHEGAARPVIRNAGERTKMDFIVDGAMPLVGAIVDTGDRGNVMNMSAKGPIAEHALALASKTTLHTYGKGKHTETTTDRTHMQVTDYIGKGVLNQISDSGVHMEAPNVNTTVKVYAPSLDIAEVHDSCSEQSTTESRGKGSRKTVRTTMQAFFSRGGKFRGPEFIAVVNHFSATGAEFDTHADVTATVQADFPAGTSSSASQTISVYKGAIWNGVRQSGESHQTRQPCQFLQPFRLHGPSSSVERMAGSGAIANLISDTPPTYLDVIDQHQSYSRSQRTLAAAPAILTKLAVGLVLWCNPVTFGLSGLSGTMASAGFGALCADASTSLIENDLDPGRAFKAMAKNGTALNIARSMVTAGLVSEVSGVAGIRTTDLELVDYAKKAAIQSAVNTALSVAEGQDVGQAMRQGAVWMAVNTAASWGAGSIGDARSTDQGADRISAATHKILHGMLGASLGSATAAITGSDVGIGALSGAVGSVVAEMTAEGLDSKDATDHQRNVTAQVANLTATVAAFAAGLDAGIALSVAQNATTHNFLAHPGDRLYLEDLGIMEEGELALGEGECPPTPRTLSAIKAFDEYNALYKSLDDAQRESHRMLGNSAEKSAESAYHGTQRLIAEKAVGKFVTGQGITDYERVVVKDCVQSGAITMAANVATSLGLGAIAASVKPIAMSVVGGKAISAKMALLPAPATVKHHIFNKFRGKSAQSEKYRQFFQKHKINVDDYTVEITDSMHKSRIHAAGQNWTTEWKRWIDMNSEATTKQVYQKAGEMMDRYGISHVPLIPY